MKNQSSTRGVGQPASRRRPDRSALSPGLGFLTAALALCGPSAARADGGGQGQGTSPDQVRAFIAEQVGGLDKLMVPADNADLPQPLLPDGTPDPFFQTTEAKRYLGKLLFHDPVRSVRIVPEFGGVPETARTASCGSCHAAQAGSKAGTLFNFAVGGEGLGYTTERGEFIPRRRPRTDLLPQVRDEPLFRGDALVDALPTLTDIYEFAIGSPALGQLPGVGDLLATGRLDALDSVGRNAPSVLGFAFNTRLLLDGFAGEPDETDGGLNPLGHPAQENLTLLLLDAHRMLDAQSAALQAIPAYVQLFRDAFPEEAVEADLAGNLDPLVNDVTVVRATASYLRTVVTRNTPWDRFLAGDDNALTAAQRRGARLFFTAAEGGAGGAGCYSCHSGPMINKQVDDLDVTGVGAFVEENFFNLGLTDHPLQALNREVRMDPTFRDVGRKEITGRDRDAFEFRTLTLRQLRDSGVFMHGGSLASLREVVEYFNAGIPQDLEAGTAPTITPRFTHPRGPGQPPGLGLGSKQVDDLTDFLENALFDPAFVEFDPDSTTDSFQLNERDLTYSVYHPELLAHDVLDGWLPSRLAPDNDDPLSRRDLGLEFLDVTAHIEAKLILDNPKRDVYLFTNDGDTVVDTHLLVVVQGLPAGAELRNGSGITSEGDPFIRVFLENGVLAPDEFILVEIRFKGPPFPGDYSLLLLSGQGTP